MGCRLDMQYIIGILFVLFIFCDALKRFLFLPLPLVLLRAEACDWALTVSVRGSLSPPLNSTVAHPPDLAYRLVWDKSLLEISETEEPSSLGITYILRKLEDELMFWVSE